MPESRFRWYLFKIHDAESLNEIDLIMEHCASDPLITSADFYELTLLSRDIIQAHDWLE